jgi:hypothetical protein
MCEITRLLRRTGKVPDPNEAKLGLLSRKDARRAGRKVATKPAREGRPWVREIGGRVVKNAGGLQDAMWKAWKGVNCSPRRRGMS